MRKLVTAFALAGAIGSGSALAVDDPTWGAWASTDGDALARILAADHSGRRDGNPQLGPEDSALLDAGALVTDLLNSVAEQAGLSLDDLLDPANIGAVNDTLGSLPVDLPVDSGDLGSVVDDAIDGTGVCTGILGAVC